MSFRCGVKLFIVSFLFTFPLIANPEDQQPAFENTQPVSDWLRIQEFVLNSPAGYIKAKE
jgi:hypothetical protein